jgi:O-antigen/teichoic acid export membrane protein
MHNIARRVRDIALPSAGGGTNEETRANERHRRILWSTLASVGARLASVATTFFSVPLTLNYLGSERFGMWLMLSSFLSLLSFADLGIGNGLLTRVAAASGRDDKLGIREDVASAYAALGLASVGMIALFWSIFPVVQWGQLFNVADKVALAEAGAAAAVFATCFALSIPAQIAAKVQTGLQGGYVPALWQCGGNLIGLAAVLAAIHFELGLPWLVLAFMGSPLAANAAFSLTFFLVQHPELRFRWQDISSRAATQIIRTGWIFLVLQIVAAASYSTDPLLISHLLGPELVPAYSVPAQMFSALGLIISMALAPLWPAYGEAISRADHRWAHKTLLRSLVASVIVAGIGAALIAILAPTLLRLWVGPAIQAGPALLLGLAAWRVLDAAGNAVGMFLNGAQAIRLQAIVAVLSGMGILALKFLLIPAWGVAGGIWATVFGFTVFAVVPLTLAARRLLPALEDERVPR